MHHKVTISQGTFETKPHHGQCACGVAGDFSSYRETYDWAVHHCARLSTGISTSELPPAPTEPSDSEAAAPVSESDGSKKNESETSFQNETLGEA